MAVAPTMLALLLLCALWAPTADALSAREAWAYCGSIGWAIDSTHSTNAIICTKRGTSWSSNCNSCTTWRLVVYANGGYDHNNAGQTYQTLAGQYYGGHSPCTSGWNLPHCGQWAATSAPPPTPTPPTPAPPTPTPPTPAPPTPQSMIWLTEGMATAYCNNLGWTVHAGQGVNALVCTAPGVSWSFNCNSCTSWRLVVWTDGGYDVAGNPTNQPYQTTAGYYYGGHSPCASGWNLPYCDRWAPLPVTGLTQLDASTYCTGLGWTADTSMGTNAVVCSSINPNMNCNSCASWRLVVYADGGHDGLGATGGQPYYSLAGHYYGGHSPCQAGWNLPYCGQWGF